MLFFVKVRVEPKNMSLDDLWAIWEKEAEGVPGAKQAGKVISIYKVVGQRRVIIIFDAESHDELDRILMAGVPMAHYLEIEEILPLRAYENFANDIKRRWK
ncbi:MAG: translational initiation factor [Candidatus Tectomicrobia bacterium]|uniref:Translational initiation factor n=1 Tax=Tectimicrobiota bacterium TaxID=2528274 RepID=A0A933GK17_UNCTE|nr:translational initiation factor [Candidatus Tectomicrobia bacterium]